MAFTTYILVNKDRTRTYVGQTKEVLQRLEFHNKDKVRSTRFRGPWNVLYSEEHDTRAKAMAREKWFKSRRGREKINELMLERWPSG